MKKYPIIAETIYHKDISDYNEEIIVVDIDTKNEKIQVDSVLNLLNEPYWISVDGWSYIQDYRSKKYMHDFASKIEIFTDPMTKAENDRNNELLLAQKCILYLTREIVE